MAFLEIYLSTLKKQILVVVEDVIHFKVILKVVPHRVLLDIDNELIGILNVLVDGENVVKVTVFIIN